MCLVVVCARELGKISWFLIVVVGQIVFFSSRRRDTRYFGDGSSDVCSSVLWFGGGSFPGDFFFSGREKHS